MTKGLFSVLAKLYPTLHSDEHFAHHLPPLHPFRILIWQCMIAWGTSLSSPTLGHYSSGHPTIHSDYHTPLLSITPHTHLSATSYQWQCTFPLPLHCDTTTRPHHSVALQLRQHNGRWWSSSKQHYIICDCPRKNNQKSAKLIFKIWAIIDTMCLPPRISSR